VWGRCLRPPPHGLKESFVSLYTRTAYLVAMKLIVLLVVSLAALALPGGAFAGSCAPPGNSGVDQYFETVPGAGCNQPSTGGTRSGGHNGGSGGHNGGGNQLSPATNRKLAGQGAAGRAVQRLVTSTGPGSTPTQANASGASGSSQSHKPGRHAVSGVSVKVPQVTGRSLLSALLHPILNGSTSSGGAGILLPIFLAGALLLAIAALVLRRRRRLSS
jgi:hypothetical protein